MLPVISMVETVGSSVHMVANTCAAVHLHKTMNLRRVPSVSGEKPNPSLTESMSCFLNMSKFRTTLCLIVADEHSPTIMDGYTELSLCLNMDTISMSLLVGVHPRVLSQGPGLNIDRVIVHLRVRHLVFIHGQNLGRDFVLD